MSPLFRKSKPSHRPSRATDGAGDQQRIEAVGIDLLDRARKHRSGMLSARFYQDKLMDWSMKDHDFKVQLFRFVDTYPVLNTPAQVHEHLVDYMSQPGVNPPPGLELGLRASGVAKGLATRTISGQITSMAQKFIAGTDAADALPKLEKLWQSGIAFSVDLLGEACVSDDEADAYRDKYLDLVHNLPETVGGWKPNQRLESDHLGPIPRTNVSIKISSLSAKCDPIDTEGAIRDLMSRLLPILEAARDRGVFINFDMEQFELKDLTLDLFERCCETIDFHAGLAMQAYLKSGVEDARRVASWAKRTGKTVTVRLVKGAYWDFETIHAEEMGWPCPVWNEKWQTDRCFEQMTEVFLDACPRSPAGPSAGESANTPGVKLALGSHNVRSIAHALVGLERRGLPTNAIELQMLHGMADQLKHASSELGLRVREYVPVGEMIPGMAYLVRRLLENTSNESWLKAGFLDDADSQTLLADPARLNGRTQQRGAGSQQDGGAGFQPATEDFPHASYARNEPHESRDRAPTEPDLYEIAPERHQLSPAPKGVGDSKPFFTEPLRDFSREDVRQTFAAAIARARVPQVANDRTPEQAIAMVARAHDLFPQWRDADPRARAKVLTDAAAAMRARRDELSGIIIKENGKDWRNADADVTETIDFCEFYARCAVPLFERQRLGRFIGELDETWYQPRGVALVVSPWNFPLAISGGMTAAALVTGNTTILKPAEQTPGIARVFAEIIWAALESAKLPRDVLQFCPAPGETTGAALVRDPRVALIAFTGSKAVGLNIIEAAGQTPKAPPPGPSTPVGPSASEGAPPSPAPSGGGVERSEAEGVSPPPGKSASAKPTPALPPNTNLYPPSAYPQPHVKKVVCEMGGKNAIIVDASADLDEAVLGIRYSAFGFQGQKCSACSRVVVVDPEGPQGPAIRRFIERFVASTKSLIIDDPMSPGSDVGPVIDDAAAANIRRYIQIAKEEGCKLELSDTDFPKPTPVGPSASEGVDQDVGAQGTQAQRHAGTKKRNSQSESCDPSPTIPDNYIPPHIFSGVTPEHTIAREEIFGPVVAVMHATDFDEALAIANGVPYKLTGGVFTRKPAHIEKAKREFRVGNLYINRGCTGALVGRQPFGGFGMSGVGSKAGGLDYLLQFVEPRACCENTMRRGFAPEL